MFFKKTDEMKILWRLPTYKYVYSSKFVYFLLPVIESAPQIDRSSIKTEFVVNKGTEVTFTVPFKGTPTPTATWFFKGKQMSKSQKVSYIWTICGKFHNASYIYNFML